MISLYSPAKVLFWFKHSSELAFFSVVPSCFTFNLINSFSLPISNCCFLLLALMMTTKMTIPSTVTKTMSTTTTDMMIGIVGALPLLLTGGVGP